MEAANNERCRKRAREDDDNTDQIRRYEFHDGIGVFDFPWLKEGVSFNSEPSFEDDDEQKFAPCSYLHEDDVAEITSVCSPQNLSDDGGGKKEEEEERIWSLAVDDLEQVDCIWSCVINQPLDVGFNKA